jgi:hypothetical protein
MSLATANSARALKAAATRAANREKGRLLVREREKKKQEELDEKVRVEQERKAVYAARFAGKKKKAKRSASGNLPTPRHKKQKKNRQPAPKRAAAAAAEAEVDEKQPVAHEEKEVPASPSYVPISPRYSDDEGVQSDATAYLFNEHEHLQGCELRRTHALKRHVKLPPCDCPAESPFPGYRVDGHLFGCDYRLDCPMEPLPCSKRCKKSRRTLSVDTCDPRPVDTDHAAELYKKGGPNLGQHYYMARVSLFKVRAALLGDAQKIAFQDPFDRADYIAHQWRRRVEALIAELAAKQTKLEQDGHDGDIYGRGETVEHRDVHWTLRKLPQVAGVDLWQLKRADGTELRLTGRVDLLGQEEGWSPHAAKVPVVQWTLYVPKRPAAAAAAAAAAGSGEGTA